MTRIPFVDLSAQNDQVTAEIKSGFDRVIANTSFILGAEVAEFEAQFATFVNAKHCVGVANGTDALELIVRATAIGAGDEIILPTNTFIATALAVHRAGATPVLVDCDPDYHLINPELVRERISARTRAIMPVHLYGQLAPMERLRSLVSGRDILLIEDAAQAQGARRDGKDIGQLATAAATSFYPSKNLGAFGDAGAVITNSDAVAEKVRALRNYGSTIKYHHPETGFNSRLGTLQAVVLKAKLKFLSAWNQQRQAAAKRYGEMLGKLSAIKLPQTLSGNEHIWHLYVIRVPNRDRVLARLNEMGIGASVHYPLPIHLQPAFKHLGHKRGDFPVAEKAAEEILSLPMYPEITSEQQARVVEALQRAL